MPKRHRKSSDKDSTERLEKKIRKYQKILSNRQEVELEVRSSEKQIDPQLGQEKNNQQIDLEHEEILDRENVENMPPDENCVTEEILKLLQDNPKISKAVEPKLHKDISDRLEGWITDGLPKEDQEKLIKKYSRPDFLEAPKLNPEVEPAMQEAAIKRDKHFLENQNNIGSAIASVGSALSLILSADEEGLDELLIIERLSDTIRFLADLFNKQTVCRRAFILPGLKHKLKAALEKTKAEEFLFGKELSEKIKQVGVMEKMADT
ncbi:uncharacterized protein LOC120358225 [Solenopsis invicta]|uniref:uncharacterized protein LOC120358225 n=1 Tax=Solenopsis invicta TaxID=13686 RepID=UPI00193DA532|nr:uncharacterized protein LOC120358225 [Solenopsis invicta]